MLIKSLRTVNKLEIDNNMKKMEIKKEKKKKEVHEMEIKCTNIVNAYTSSQSLNINTATLQ